MSDRPSPRPKRAKFVKKSFSYPSELVPFIKQRLGDPRFRGQLSTYITYLLAEEKERLTAA